MSEISGNQNKSITLKRPPDFFLSVTIQMNAIVQCFLFSLLCRDFH